MKKETKIIIIGVVATVLVLVLALFIMFKVDQRKENKALESELKEMANPNGIGDEAKDAYEPITLYIFHGSTCPHCKNAISKIESNIDDFNDIVIKKYEVWNNSENKSLMTKVASKLGVSASGVPFFVIGSYAKAGYSKDDILAEIEKNINNEDYVDVVEEVLEENPGLNVEFEYLESK